ncbi:hypothetical protein [Flavobacterium sp. UBA6046]|jgi:hypothetical protein|uniref:hypothetical protein n=1 Tax=Flavobacterium sp. UBA6046 TaxID=1946552 RepID=UPI0025C48BDF|nr:hypothetical protein [Flavobacterium sp. UBA6046]
MTSTLLNKNPRAFFQGRKAKVIAKQRNIDGDEINKDEIVEIISRTRDSKISLDIKSTSGIIIYNVWCEQLELIPEENDKN